MMDFQFRNEGNSMSNLHILGTLASSTGGPPPGFVSRVFSLAWESPDTGDHQGVTSDGTHFYTFHNSRIAKYDKDWNLVSENLNIWTEMGIPAGNMISSYVRAGKITTVRGLKIHVWNASDLSYSAADSGTDLSESFSGVSDGPNPSYIYGVTYEAGMGSIKVYDLASGAFVQNIPLSQPVNYAQGITYFSGRFYISGGSGADKVFEYETDGTFVQEAMHVLSTAPGINGIGSDEDYIYVLFDNNIEGIRRLSRLDADTPQASSKSFSVPLVNVDAETGDTSGWVVDVGTPVADDGSVYASAPREGTYFFAGGVSDFCQMRQVFNVPDDSWGQVDAGLASFDLSWHQRGDPGAGTKDVGRVVVRYFDSTAAQIGLLVPSAISADSTTYDLREVLGDAVPAGTRSFAVEINCARNTGTQLNAYFDGVYATMHY